MVEAQNPGSDLIQVGRLVKITLTDESQEEQEICGQVICVYAGWAAVRLSASTTVQLIPIQSVVCCRQLEAVLQTAPPHERIKRRAIHFRRRKRPKQDSSIKCPDDVAPHKWQRRHFLFERFDEGIRLDDESWYSVTPHMIATHIANKCTCAVLLDAFSGVGGNAIAFALTCQTVVASELVANKITYAKQNAEIYEIDNQIDWVNCNVLDLLSSLPDKALDIVFLSPPWGGPGYREKTNFSLRKDIMLFDSNKELWNGVDILKESVRVASLGVVYFLPRNLTAETFIDETGFNDFVFETHIVDRDEPFTVCVYLGDFK